MDELREHFRASSRPRIAEMRELVATPPDAVRVQTLARHFHALSGLGGTYGFARVSELGDEAEASILPLARGGGVPDARTLARWRELIEEIARELC